jgi:tripartite-type tricarboxylate transporter receptor subunit TctC
MIKKTLSKFLSAALAVTAITLFATGVQAQNYPTRPVMVIVPFAAGSASDVVTRIMLNKMGTSLGQNFIVENRPGAGGNSGTAYATRATPAGCQQDAVQGPRL